MNKLLLTAAAALSLTACIKKDDPPDAIKRAIPTADQVKINLPANSERAIGQLADWYVATRQITSTFNGGSAWVLILIHTIVEFPVTSVDGDTYTWGPFGEALDPAEYKLDVKDVGDGTYTWALSGRPRTQANGAFEVIIDGNSDPRAGELSGNGKFLIDFDAGRRVNPIDADPEARGQIEVTYDLATRHLDLDIASTDDRGEPVFATYEYNEAADRSGDMVFELDGDMGGGAELEHAVVRSRWQADGAGRADVGLSGGDTENPAGVLASECWNTTFSRVFFAVVAGDASGAFGAAEGSESNCAYTTADRP
ncbi:MAG: hypothetical protein ABI867_02340 [Kofleriaceae bacterium]